MLQVVVAGAVAEADKISVGSSIVTGVDADVQFKASVTTMSYVPATNPVVVAVVETDTPPLVTL